MPVRFRRSPKLDYQAKLYVLADSQDLLTEVSNSGSEAITRNGGKFTGGSSMYDEHGSHARITFVTSSQDVAHRFLDEWVEAARTLEGVLVTGRTLGSEQTGFEVWDVTDEDVEWADHITERWFRENAPKEHKKLYGERQKAQEANEAALAARDRSYYDYINAAGGFEAVVGLVQAHAASSGVALSGEEALTLVEGWRQWGVLRT